MIRTLTTEQLVIVTGKGGVGKTSLAAALAVLSAKQGLRTILVTFDTEDTVHPAFGVRLRYKPKEVHERLAVSRVDAFEAVREYVRRKMPMASLYEGFFKGRTFRDFAAATPGFEELMCLGKLYDLATSSLFDRVIFDAPSSGYMKILLGVPDATLNVVQVGPLNHNARKIQHLLWDAERTRIIIAALPEEMAVREALELTDYCRDERRMAVGPMILNQVVPKRFSSTEIERLAEIDAPSPVLRAAIAAAQSEHQLATVQEQARQAISHWPDVLEVPRLLPDGEPDEENSQTLINAMAEPLSVLFGDQR
ncbi:MAG: AAA family ATPase [Gammaproteobacteria bacterium]|nr:AAA family ATPase [Gammaproteobacteria bacterium]MCZ6853767.1 AAA family ATPase [Gammaproteobacteria bacterium]